MACCVTGMHVVFQQTLRFSTMCSRSSYNLNIFKEIKRLRLSLPPSAHNLLKVFLPATHRPERCIIKPRLRHFFNLCHSAKNDIWKLCQEERFWTAFLHRVHLFQSKFRTGYLNYGQISQPQNLESNGCNNCLLQFHTSLHSTLAS